MAEETKNVKCPQLFEALTKLFESKEVSMYKMSKLSGVSASTIKKYLTKGTASDESINKLVDTYNSYVAPRETGAAPKQEEVKDTYIEAINKLANNAEFANALKTVIDAKAILQGEISKEAAVACTNIVNRALGEISKSVSKEVLGI